MGKGRGCGRETPEPTFIIFIFFVWFIVLNDMALSRGSQMETAYQIEANFQRVLNDYWSVEPTCRGVDSILSVDDVAKFISRIYIPNFVNYDPSDHRTSQVSNGEWPGVVLKDKAYTRIGNIYVTQALRKSVFSTDYQDQSYTYTDPRDNSTRTQQYTDADGLSNVGANVVPYAGYYWKWSPSTTQDQALSDINQMLFNRHSGWNDPSLTGMIRVYATFMNNKNFFRSTLSFYFKTTGGVYTRATTQVLVPQTKANVWLFMITGGILFLYMLWQIVSLRSLWPKKWTRWVDLFNGILFLIAVANVLLIESTVDKMDIKSFSNWEDSGLKLNFIADADLQFPDHPNLSRMLLANYVTSMMVVWRFCIGILTFSGYMRFVDKISPMFPLLTYPMDVIAAGGTSTIVFCITISMIVLGFVQMFVAPYYLYLEQTKDFPTTLHFLFQNLVGNTNTRVFLIPDVSDSGQGTAMLTVFLFVMTYVFFTMFVAIIATNYRVVCRQIEKTPFHDFEPFKARMTRLFCEYPKICKAIGPFGFIRHICSGREDDQDMQAQANARDEPAGPEEEDGDGLTISAVEELSDVEKSRREIEAAFFERFEKLHENMRILEVHFETLMGRTEQIADLQDRVVEVSDLQSGLEEALAMHYKHVRQQIKLSDMKGLSSPTSSPKHAISPKHDLGLSLDGSIRV